MPVELDTLGEWITPVALAGERTLPLDPALEPLVPGGALQRGTVLSFARGPGATSLALAMAARPSAEGSWTAVVGTASIGLAAAGDLGVALDRLLVIEPVAPDRWATVVAALVDAVDMVVVAGRHRVAPQLARRLATRLREQGAVLFDLSDCWPEAAEVALTVEVDRWLGIGEGHGHLEGRRVAVRSVARRDHRAERRVELLLPGPRGAVELLEAGEAGEVCGPGGVVHYAGSDFEDGTADEATSTGEVVPLHTYADAS